MPANLPMIVAHRGLHRDAPENSVAAFIAAANAGISWVECDVWPSSDNTAMVIHDPTLERTSSHTGEVRKYTAAELKQIGVPSLDDVVEALNHLTAPGLVVEIKPRINRLFVESVLESLGVYDGIRLVQSFHDDNIVRAWGTDDSLHTAMLVDTSEDMQKAIERGWPMINAHHSLVDEALVAKLHSTGRRIGAWTVNEPADIRRMIQLGIDLLITDEPILATENRDR